MDHHKREIDAAIAVAEARAIGPRRARRLLESFGSFAAAISANDQDLAAGLGTSLAVARRLRRSFAAVSAAKHRRGGSKHASHAMPLSGPAYPPLLAEICDPPIVLWCRGDTSLLSRPTIGIVGARRCSSTASAVIDRFVDAFAGAGFLVLSGGARGIDAAAHRAALRAGIPTIVVLGSGFGHPYPPEHICLFDQIVEAGGLLLTEYTDDIAPRPAHFPARNRIVAGLCVAILVHEAGARSGALITARLAAEDYGRDVMVVPGSILDGRSRGSHRAVSEGWAMLVDDPKDAVERVYESQGLLMALSEAAAISARSGSTPSPSVPM